MSEHKTENSRLLPIAEVNGKEFLVDIKNRQFRKFGDSDEVIAMHSKQGRKIVEDMPTSEWKCYGFSTGAADKTEV